METNIRELTEDRFRLWSLTVSPTRGYSTRKGLDKHLLNEAWVDMPVSGLSPELLQRYVNDVSLQPASAKWLWQWLTNVFDDCVSRRQLDQSPWKSVKTPTATTRETAQPRFSFSELMDIIDGDGQWTPVHKVLAGTLLRPGEIRNLRVEDIHLTAANPFLVVRFGDQGPTKSGKTRRVPIFDFVQPALRQLIGDRTDGLLLVNPGTRRAYTRNFDFGLKDALKQRGMDGRRYTLYSFRRAGADALLNGDFGFAFSIELVSAMLGHADITTTQIYCGVKDRALLEAAKNIRIVPITPINESPRAKELRAAAKRLRDEADRLEALAETLTTRTISK